MEFPEGKYSVKDTFEEVAKNPEAFEIVRKAMKLATNFDIIPGEGMWGMMKNMSPYGMTEMMPMPEGFIESINAKLIKIDKVQHL